MNSDIIISVEYEKDFFFPGETVCGQAVISLSKAREIKSVTLKAKGFAKVCWSEGGGNSRHTYRSSEDYYNFEFQLFTSISGSQNFDVGTYKYKFSFLLPILIPSSFESHVGEVKHLCKVDVDVHNRLFHIKKKAPFSVVGLYDLNADEFSKEPVILRKEKTVHKFPWKSGTLSIAVNLDHAGYVSGESIIINAECSNKSNKNTKETEASLYQFTTYYAENQKNRVEKKICSKSHKGIESGEDDIWSGENLSIPPIPPSGLPFCSIINIEYIFFLTIYPSGLSSRLEVSSPIVIGTIPLRKVFENLTENPFLTQVPVSLPAFTPPLFIRSAPASPADEDASMTFGPDSPPPTPSSELCKNYPDLPPLYRECSRDSLYSDSDSDGEKKSSRDKNAASNEFRPTYLTYKWKD